MEFVDRVFNSRYRPNRHRSPSQKLLLISFLLIIIILVFSVNTTPTFAAENAPSNLNVNRTSRTNVQLNWQSNTTLPAGLDTDLAWFYGVHDNMNLIRNEYEVFVLSKNFESQRDWLERQGESPVLQYIRFDSIHDPCYQAQKPVGSTCSCNQRPLNNNVGWNSNDVCWIRDNHRDWFLKDSKGNLIYSGFNGGDPFVIMDPGSQGWRDFFLDRIKQTQNNGWDGIMLDNLPEIFTAHSGQRIALRDYGDNSYHNAVVGFLDYIGTNYFDSRDNKPIYANFSAQWDRGWRYDNVVAELDGVMDEYWAVTRNGYYPSLSFQKRLEGAVRTLNAGKHMVLVSQGDRYDSARQEFSFATYLLVASENTSFRYTNADTGGYGEVWLYDNYDTYLGDPSGRYYRSGDRYYRNFTHGRVWVNPLNRTSAIEPNPLGFEIQRSTNGGRSFSALAMVDPNTTRYVDSDAAGDYCYRVRFFNGNSRSGFSPVSCVDGDSTGGSSDDGPLVSGLTLVNGYTGQPISGYDPIPNNAQINLSQLPGKVNIRANITSGTQSVRFNLSGEQSHNQMENMSPYELFGDDGGQLRAGNYAMSVSAYSGSSGGGSSGGTYTLNFSIGSQSTGGSNIYVGEVTLINANNNSSIRTLTDGASFDLANLPTRDLNIGAEGGSSQVASIYFQLSGAQSTTRTENAAPYALFGDNGGNYFSWTPRTGSYTLRITPYSSASRQGQQGDVKTITFTVTDSNRREGDVIVIGPSVATNPLEIAANHSFASGIVRPTFTWTPAVDENGVVISAPYYNVTVVDQSGATVLDGWAETAAGCVDSACSYTPDAAVLPGGLPNGDYTWWVRSWSEGGFSDLSDEGLLTINVPTPILPTMTVQASEGYPVMSWSDDPNAAWVQIYVGALGGIQHHMQWVEESAGICDGVTCTLPLDLSLPAGDYEVYAQSWGAGGMSRGGTDGWAGPFGFSIAGNPAALVSNITTSKTDAGYTVLNWVPAEGATWYHLWVGTTDGVQVVDDWYEGANLTCDDGLCSVTLTLALPAGEYTTYVQSWGPGGFSTGGVDGWAQGPVFTP